MSNTRRPRRRDDRPYDFNLDAVQAAAELRPFVVQHAGRRWTLVHMDTLDAFDLLAAADHGDAAAARRIFALALGDDWDDFRSHPMPRYKLDRMFTAYQKHCGLKQGEGPASTDS
ncbi:hypothetical protein [Streptomyces sp. LS1784]|uniref:hypothetical protein n=1 Tax=Streptomyces sp. LS1784 TaxID=2851533 RepID=UPI001CD031E5|nr:hypothetical protein [Streptomyces sp. LS1784]